jgi:2-dehydropantoate 2-reductase
LKICVLGAGSLGSAIGAALAEAGSDVWLVNRNRAHVDAINDRGLRVRTDDGERTVRVAAAVDCAGLAPVDLVIVLVKSFDTRKAIEAAGPVIGRDTVVMSLQNGLGHEEVLGAVVGRQRLLAGRTYVGGQILAPGIVLAGTRGKETIIGELDGRITDRVRAIADEFDRAGLATTVSGNVMGTIWDKLLVNVATGALAGITRLPYGRLYAVPEVEAAAVAAVTEAMAVARAGGIALSYTDPHEPWLRAGKGLPFDFKASILQSLEKGSVTEIDFINGAVVREGRRLGVPTPVNDTLVACIRGIEHGLATVPPSR